MNDAARVRFVHLGEDPVSTAQMAAAVADDHCGAVVTFDGVVRDHDGGRPVRSLDYSAHPQALAELERVAQEVAARHPEVRLALAHRLGSLRIGETALACAVSAAHRREAFEACEDAVTTLKRTVPIWKHQVFTDGTEEWVGALD